MHQFSGFLKIGMMIGLMSGIARGQQGEFPANTLSEWTFGDAIFGDELKMADLRGKVVAIEYWGTGCGSCLNSLSQLVEVDKKYRSKGLRVIAAEMRESPRERIGKVVKDYGVDFTVTKGMSGPVSVGGFPHALVFDTEGKIVFKGRPASEEFEKAIDSAVKDVKISPVVSNTLKVSEELGAGDLIAKRTWTNMEGKPLEASVTEITGDKVIFKLESGKTVPYAIEKLSEADQKLIKTKASE